MQKISIGVEWIIRLFLYLAVIALLTMMSAIVADVFMRYVFNAPITGVYDVVEISLVVVVFFSLGTAILGFHEIVIDLVDRVASPRLVKLFKSIAALLSAAVLIFIFIAMLTPAMQSHQYGEIKLELNMPVWIVWVIALVGMCGGIMASLLNVVRQLKPNLPGPNGGLNGGLKPSIKHQ